MKNLKFRAYDTISKKWLTTDEMPIVPEKKNKYFDF